MALRLRRGTDSQRQLITPTEGELIYTTDTKRLWVGDGTTAGGILVNTGVAYGLDDLIDVDLTIEPEVGDVLKFDGTNFIPAPEGAFTEGGNYYINLTDELGEPLLDADGRFFTGSIRGLDNVSILVDADNQRMYAEFFGNLTGDVIGDVTGDLTGNVTGNVTGDLDGNVLGNVIGTLSGDVDGTLRGSVFSEDGSTIIVDVANERFYGDLIGNVTGNVFGELTGDSTGVHYGSVVGNVTGNVLGSVVGDLKGSVFSDDSTIVIDATTGQAPLLKCDVNNTNIITVTVSTDEVIINQLPLDDVNRNPGVMMFSQSDGPLNGPFIQMVGYRGSEGPGQQPLQVGDSMGQIRFSSANFGTNINRPIPVILNTAITDVGDGVTTFTKGKLQIGLLNGPNPANANFAEFSKGGVWSSPVFKVGTYATTTDRDDHFTNAGITPEAGMIIFLIATGKFQGYDGTVWADLN